MSASGLVPAIATALPKLIEGALALAAVLEAVVAGLEPVHLVGAGGAIGAICRHWVYERIEADGFPFATFVVNVVGSVALGLVVFAGASETALAFFGTGVCGAFTTFSTFSVETVRLWEGGDRRLAVANALANLFCSLAGIGVAWALVAVA